MTPAYPKRFSPSLTSTVVLATLLLGLAGPSPSGSQAAAAPLTVAVATVVPPAPEASPHAPGALVPEPVAGAAARTAWLPTAVPIADPIGILRRAKERYMDQLPFGNEIRRVARVHRLDSLLLASVVEAESSFQPDAVSSKGALGLMQLMPFHFDDTEQPLDPDVNLEAGASYLAELEHRFDGDLDLVLAAYHAGPAAVERWGGVPPYRTTRAYVHRVLTRYREHWGSVERRLILSGRPAAAVLQRGS
jgi:soluble lytic murein transglycosylase-like protein